ncbi:MAG TPA: hypothetical protein DGR97_03000 [Gammaproteobacteria bacterium]|nr:hypothetical protein [Gammaproteobacteria bacterium]
MPIYLVGLVSFNDALKCRTLGSFCAFYFKKPCQFMLYGLTLRLARETLLLVHHKMLAFRQDILKIGAFAAVD